MLKWHGWETGQAQGYTLSLSLCTLTYYSLVLTWVIIKKGVRQGKVSTFKFSALISHYLLPHIWVLWHAVSLVSHWPICFRLQTEKKMNRMRVQCSHTIRVSGCQAIGKRGVTGGNGLHFHIQPLASSSPILTLSFPPGKLWNTPPPTGKLIDFYERGKTRRGEPARMINLSFIRVDFFTDVLV